MTSENLNNLAASIKRLSFGEMNDFVVCLPGISEAEAPRVLETMRALVDWSKAWIEEHGEAEPPLPPLPRTLAETDVGIDPKIFVKPPETEEKPPPEKEIHLDIPEGAQSMCVAALVPVDMAEDFQRQLPDWGPVKYACDFIMKGELGGPDTLQAFIRSAWEAWVK